MSDLLDKIKSRGFWRFLIRPSEYDAERLPYEQLASIIQRVAVSLRGWDLPHRDTRTGPQMGADWVGQETEWQHHVDAWRLHRSGQLVIFRSLAHDWRDQSSVHPPGNGWQPGQFLSVGDAVFTFTEVFELAARMSGVLPGSDAMVVKIDCQGIEKRVLHVDDPRRAPLFFDYAATIPSFEQEWELDRAVLMATARDLAVVGARELFLRFGWHADIEVLRGNQAELAG